MAETNDTGLLSEHQSPHEAVSTQPGAYTPTDEEKRILKRVNKTFEKNKKHRSQYDRDWLDYYRYWRGKQWKEARPSYRHSEVVNFIFQTIQSQVPILTDAKQRIEFSAQEPSDMEFAKILDECCESDWETGNWTYKIAEMIYDGHILGTGIGGLTYDDKALMGAGRIAFDSVDPMWCFPAPKARNLSDRCPNFVVAEPVDMDEIKAEYPDKAKWIKADLVDLIQGNKRDLDSAKYKSPVDNRTTMDGGSNFEFNASDQVLKITCYYLDDTEIEEDEGKPDLDPETQAPLLDDMGQPKMTYTQKRKYPNGRKACIAGGVVLHDGAMDLDEPLHPYVKFANYIDPREFWGISEVEQLKGPQNIFNKIYSFVLDVMTLMGNPIWVVDSDSEVDTDNLFNRPGLVVEKAKGTEVRREQGTQLQPYVLQILDRVEKYVQGVAGDQDVSRGVRPEGITAASAISQLQEAAQTRIRQKSRNLDATLQDLGKLYKSYSLKYYDAPRVFRLTGNEGSQKYFKMHVENREMEDGSSQRVASVRQYVQDPVSGQHKEAFEAKEYVIRGDFDVKVSTGSTLPFAKDAKFARARQMFQDGVIDDEEYLKAADYPNWQAVLQRVNEKKAQAAAEAAAAQGAPPQGPPPAA